MSMAWMLTDANEQWRIFEADTVAGALVTEEADAGGKENQCNLSKWKLR